MRVLTKGPWEIVNAYGTHRRRALTYRAKFYDSGKYAEQDCADILYQRHDGGLMFLNTSSGVSYYGELLREASK